MPRRQGAVPQICERGLVPPAAARTIALPVVAIGEVVAGVLALVAFVAVPGIAVIEVAVAEAAWRRRIVALIVVVAAIVAAVVRPVAISIEIAGAVVAAGQAVGRVAVARMDEVVTIAAPPVVVSTFDAIGIPAVRPARVARAVAIRLALARTA